MPRANKVVGLAVSEQKPPVIIKEIDMNIFIATLIAVISLIAIPRTPLPENIKSLLIFWGGMAYVYFWNKVL